MAPALDSVARDRRNPRGAVSWDFPHAPGGEWQSPSPFGLGYRATCGECARQASHTNGGSKLPHSTGLVRFVRDGSFERAVRTARPNHFRLRRPTRKEMKPKSAIFTGTAMA